MGCLRRLGCLVLLILIAVIAWVTRDRWMRYLPHSLRRGDAAAADTRTWQPLTLTGANRARVALQALSGTKGPAYVNVAPGDLASYIFQELSRSLPPSADSIEAAAIGDRLYVRAVVRTADFGSALGPLGALLGDHEQVQLAGTIRVLQPGVAELQVKEIKIRELTLPSALIPRVISQMSPRQRPANLAPDALPLRVPDYIGDVRVSDGRITLYRAYRTALTVHATAACAES